MPGLPGPPPVGLWPPVAGGRRGLVVWGRARRGPSPVCPGQFSPPPEARGAQPPRPGSRQSWGLGLRGSVGRPPCGLAVPPRGGCVVVGAFLPPRVGRAALGPLRPVPAWGAVIGWPGPPQRPGGRGGRGPLSGARAVVLFGLVPCRRRSGPRFSSRAGQRWKKAVRCPARGGSAAAAAGNGPGAKPPGERCAAACTSRKILCAERVCPNGLKAHLDARVGARFFCQKRVSPFFDKFRKNPRLSRGFSLFFWRVLWYTFRRQGPDLSKRRKAFVRPGGAVL